MIVAGIIEPVEERVEKVDEEYKARIMELEAKGPMMPLEQHDVRIE